MIWRVEQMLKYAKELNQAFKGMPRLRNQRFNLLPNFPSGRASKPHTTRSLGQKSAQLLDLRQEPEFVAPVFRQKLDHTPFGLVWLVKRRSPGMGQPAAKQNQITRFKSLNGSDR